MFSAPSSPSSPWYWHLPECVKHGVSDVWSEGGNFLNLMLTLSCPLLSWPWLSYGTIMQTGMWRGEHDEQGGEHFARFPESIPCSDNIPLELGNSRVEHNGGQLGSLCVTFLPASHHHPWPPSPTSDHTHPANMGTLSGSAGLGDVSLLVKSKYLYWHPPRHCF